MSFSVHSQEQCLSARCQFATQGRRGRHRSLRSRKPLREGLGYVLEGLAAVLEGLGYVLEGLAALLEGLDYVLQGWREERTPYGGNPPVGHRQTS